MCYPCHHCNKCGHFNPAVTSGALHKNPTLVCASCGTDIPFGSTVCPECESPEFKLILPSPHGPNVSDDIK